MTSREWLPLIGMTISAFLVNTSEFMPIGLLTDISNDFNMTAAHAGVMITAYSWTVTYFLYHSCYLRVVSSQKNY